MQLGTSQVRALVLLWVTAGRGLGATLNNAGVQRGCWTSEPLLGDMSMSQNASASLFFVQLQAASATLNNAGEDL